MVKILSPARIRKALFIITLILLSTSVLALREMNCSIDECTGLVAYWKLNENPAWNNIVVYDSHNNSISGSFKTSDYPINHSLAGKLNRAFDFDGSDDYVQLNTNSKLNIYGDITIEAWIKTSDSDGFIFQRVRQFNPYQGYAFRVSGGKPGFFTSGNWWVYSTGTVNDGQWHHVAVTGSGSTGTFYIDGSESGTFSYTPSVDYTGITPYIGSERGTGGGSSFFDGIIDEARVWDTALTETEIGQIYSEGYIPLVDAGGDPEIPEFSTATLTFTILTVGLGIALISVKKRKQP